MQEENEQQINHAEQIRCILEHMQKTKGVYETCSDMIAYAKANKDWNGSTIRLLCTSEKCIDKVITYNAQGTTEGLVFEFRIEVQANASSYRDDIYNTGSERICSLTFSASLNKVLLMEYYRTITGSNMSTTNDNEIREKIVFLYESLSNGSDISISINVLMDIMNEFDHMKYCNFGIMHKGKIGCKFSSLHEGSVEFTVLKELSLYSDSTITDDIIFNIVLMNPDYNLMYEVCSCYDIWTKCEDLVIWDNNVHMCSVSKDIKELISAISK